MGVDCEIYVKGEMSYGQVVRAAEYVKERIPFGMLFDSDIHDGPFNVSDAADHDDGQERLELYVSTRYYGPGYERGDWPSIYAAIRLMQTAFPNQDVYYGGDNTDDHPVVTDEMIASLWDHYLGPDSQAYHRRRL